MNIHNRIWFIKGIIEDDFYLMCDMNGWTGIRKKDIKFNAEWKKKELKFDLANCIPSRLLYNQKKKLR